MGSTVGSLNETMSPSLRLHKIVSSSTPSEFGESAAGFDFSENDTIEIVQTKMHNKA